MLHKRIPLYVLAIVILVMVFFFLLKSNKSTHDADTDVKVVDIAEEKDYLSIHASYPSYAPTSIQNDMKSFVEMQIDQFKKNTSLETLSEEELEFLGFDDGRKYILEITFEEKHSTKLLSYIFKVVSYTGGAHDNLVIYSLNYDRDTNQRISIQDIVNADVIPTKLKEVVQEEAFNVLSEHISPPTEEQMGWIDEGLAPILNNYETFYTSDDSITFILQPYQVAPWAYGAPEVEVFVSLVKEYLSSQYFE